MTTNELHHINRSFGHPSLKATAELLKNAKWGSLQNETKVSLKEIEMECTPSRHTRTKSRNFKLAIRSKAIKFNHHLRVDTMFIDERPVVHIVDESTHFPAARFIQNQNTSTIRKSIQQMWYLTYIRLLDHIGRGSRIRIRFRRYETKHGRQ